ncbi:MAG: hypothetical protein H6523_15135 [Mycolicibacterium sp.]|nr:hypothetical protein [Mycolicibacterium sp.]
MAYEFTYFSKENNYWLGIDPKSGRTLLGIPVSNPMVDYIESYWISREDYQAFMQNHDLAIDFADACRRHEHDDHLTHPPGRYRGTPR